MGDGKQLAIALQKSSVTLFTSDTHKPRLHPQVRIGDAVAPLNRTPKSWVLRWTPTSTSAFTPTIVSSGLRGPSMSRRLGRAGASQPKRWWPPYKAIVRPILNYAAPICFTQKSSSHLDKLEVIQNKALRVGTGCHQKAVASHLRAETGVLPLRAHLELCCHQFYASAHQHIHCYHGHTITPSPSFVPAIARGFSPTVTP